jgi:hypothetical protein
MKDATIPQSVEIPKIRRIAKGKVRGALAELLTLDNLLS